MMKYSDKETTLQLFADLLGYHHSRKLSYRDNRNYTIIARCCTVTVTPLNYKYIPEIRTPGRNPYWRM